MLVEFNAVSNMNIGGNLVVTNGAIVSLYSLGTNTAPDYGMLVSVGGNIVVDSGSWIYPYSEPTNGGSVKFTADSVIIATNGGINATATGFRGQTSVNTGLGRGGGKAVDAYGCGGGYGGQGGLGRDGGGAGSGQTYGSYTAPVDPGSAGGGGQGASGSGGGVVRISASNTVTVNGSILANGEKAPGTDGGHGGGGAGGSVYIICHTFGGGINGSIQAKGGDGATDYDGGGGGGRIAIYSTWTNWLGTPITLANCVTGGLSGAGAQSSGGTGTVFFGFVPPLSPHGTVIILH